MLHHHFPINQVCRIKVTAYDFGNYDEAEKKKKRRALPGPESQTCCFTPSNPKQFETTDCHVVACLIFFQFRKGTLKKPFFMRFDFAVHVPLKVLM
jgi:hypothetical protein